MHMHKQSPTEGAFSCFVTGTDTEIGKTLITTALLHALGEAGMECAGMKPVAAGTVLIDDAWCNEDVEAIRAASNVNLPLAIVAPYVFHEPIAPHIAAQREARTISVEHIVRCYTEASAKVDAIVVEGVGGFCVPLSDSSNASDLASQLNLPIILVVGMRLGCISHALLTVEAILTRGLVLAGWVANTVDASMPCFDENVSTLKSLIPAPLLGIVPRLPEPTACDAASFITVEDITTWPVRNCARI